MDTMRTQPAVTIYLAGPIMGCTKGEANDWRIEVQKQLEEMGMIGISPLRCEPLIGERYNMEYADPKFGTPRAIASKNILDVQRCDLTLAFLPIPPEGRPQSYGTIIEIAWARCFNKPVIVVSDDPFVRKHPVIDSCVNWPLDTMDEALTVIRGLFFDYIHGAQWQNGAL